MNLSKSLYINAQDKVVWSYLIESKKFIRWNSDVISYEYLLPPPPRTGSKIKMKIKEGSSAVDYDILISELEPLRKLYIEMSGQSLGSTSMKVNYSLHKEGPHTRFDYQVTWQPQEFLLKMFVPIISWIAKRKLNKTMDYLKFYAEQESSISDTGDASLKES